MAEHIKTPWRVGKEAHEGDGSPGVEIFDADGNFVAFVTSWEAGYAGGAAERHWEQARVIVEAVNARYADG